MLLYEFTPTEKQAKESNIYRFMNRHGISSLEELSEKAKADMEWFWEKVEQDIGIVWDEPYTSTLDVSNGIAWPKWFVGGRTNIYRSSVEKFAEEDPERVAYRFVSEGGRTSEVSYSKLDVEASKLANGLKSLGVKKGDVVAIYMPMIKEAILAILAAAKIGAVQTVIFSGYSAESLHIRLRDCNAKILFVTDGFCRKGKEISQKKATESAVANTGIKKTVVVPYMGVDSYENPDVISYDSLAVSQAEQCPTQTMDSEDPLFILYTSGTTGRPKGVIHTHGGFSVFAGHQSAYLIDTTKSDTLLWPADIGWITGLVWNVYGLLMTGASAVIYDGAIDFPDNDRIWRMLSEYKVTIFGISPTAVRLFRKNNAEPQGYDLGMIKNIPATGEPLDADSWRWLFEKVGGKKIPIMNLSGGTEIGGAMLSVFPGMRIKPSTVGMPVPGMSLDVIDGDGNPAKSGHLIIRAPWPAMTRGLLNDDMGYLKSYWSQFQDVWFHGDNVRIDEDGLWYMQGRTDDVINVSGHRISTVEIEYAAISHEKISDAASVAIPDEIAGKAMVLFFVADGTDILESEVSDHVSEKIGKVARPKMAFQLSDLPRTRTGKVMRRLLRSKLLGLDLGDISSLENPGILDEVPDMSGL